MITYNIIYRFQLKEPFLLRPEGFPYTHTRPFTDEADRLYLNLIERGFSTKG
jgi:hypothetical protein